MNGLNKYNFSYMYYEGKSLSIYSSVKHLDCQMSTLLPTVHSHHHQQQQHEYGLETNPINTNFVPGAICFDTPIKHNEILEWFQVEFLNYSY
ncbi:hypothetical protein BLOT_012432 [Blomia tropicalis]|nr:hypothetical protein BLOT_012432 [Blomia tropicalis]